MRATARTAFDWSHSTIRQYESSFPTSLTIQLSKPLYDGGRNKQLVKQAEANVRAGRQQGLAGEQNILFNVVQTYANVVRDRRILEQRKSNVRILNGQSQATAKRFEGGEVTRTDVTQAKARVSGAQAAVASARAQLAASESRYEELVGHKPGRLAAPKTAKLPSSLQHALVTAQKINPNILAAAFVEDAARHNKNAIADERKPQVTFNANASAQGSYIIEPRRLFNKQTSFGADLTASLQLYDGGLDKSRERAAGYVVNQRSIEKIGAVRAVRDGVRVAWNNYRSTVEAIASAREQVRAIRATLSGVQTEYSVGSRSTIDVLNAQQELNTAEVQLIAAERDQIVASYQLLASMGKLTGRHLGF